MEKRTKIYVGGQAVIEGVMMRGPKVMATAVRAPGGDIVLDSEPTTSAADRYPFLKWPLVRGSVALVESLVIGMKALSFSARVSGEEEEQLSKRDIALTMAFAVVVSIVFFLALPTWAAKFFPFAHDNHVVLNLVEGVLRLAIFLLYIWAISLTPDIRRIFQYHGAEHKTIHTYENDVELTPANVQQFSRLHPRCGTNFLLIVMVVSIVAFAFLGWPNLFWRILSRVLLMPVVAGVAYEVIRYAGGHDNWWMRAVIAPGLLLQKMTTREPDDDMIEVAIVALEAVRLAEQDAYES